jgi:UDP:flavonoid glycosyltransferase YjiC (YdhE family)
LTAERLAEAIRVALDDPSIRRGATLLARKIAGEDGVAAAVLAFQHHFAEAGHP